MRTSDVTLDRVGMPCYTAHMFIALTMLKGGINSVPHISFQEASNHNEW